MRPGIKIGELAARTGVSVRALRHYDDIGLLSPARRTDGNQRLYGEAEIERLQRIVALRQLGFALEDIRELLDGSGAGPLELIDAHRHALRDRIARLERLAGVLDAARAEIDRGEELDVEQLLSMTEMTTMVERHYSDEQRAFLARRRGELGTERITKVQAAWPALIDEVLAAKDRGMAATSAEVAPLVDRWQTLIAAFTGGDVGITSSLSAVWEHDGERLVGEHGLNPRMAEAIAYIGEALGGR
jgi:DNA-binding transcriptional MerR regulator